MSKATKIWLIIAASLILVGSIIFAGGMTAMKWDFTKLSTNKYETNSYELTEDFNSISISTSTADIEILPAESTKSSVVCYEQTNVKHTLEVKDGSLVINEVDTRNWHEHIHIGVNFEATKIAVYIPQGEYGALSIILSTGDVKISKDFTFESISVSASTGDVTNYASASDFIKIKATTGKIFVEDISAGSLDLSVTTGDVKVSGVNCDGDVKVGVSTGKTYLTDILCQSVISDGGSGDISLKNVIVAQKLSIERTTGDVLFDGSDAAQIIVKTQTGDVEGSLLSEKVFIVDTNTGKKEVPKTVTGGRCQITTNTGDVKITIK